MKLRHKVVPASYLLVRRGNEVLLMLRQNTGYFDGWYALPSGHVELAEFPSDAMIREAKEEVGIDVAKADLRFVHALFREKHDETGERADYFFETNRWQGEPSNREPEKCAEIAWFDLDGLPEKIIPYLRLAIDDIKNRIPYSERQRDQLLS